MKKTSKIVLFVLVVVALLCGVYRLANKAPSASLESNAQMAEIIESSGCMACHTANPELPFYAGLPVAGKLVKESAWVIVRLTWLRWLRHCRKARKSVRLIWQR